MAFELSFDVGRQPKVILEGFCYDIRTPNNPLTVDEIETIFIQDGEKLLKHLAGEFALAISDSRTNSIYLVADPCEVVQSYYQICSDKIYWSTELTSFPLDKFRIDDEYIADKLVCNTWSFGKTPYVGINRIPAGHYLRVTNFSSRLVRYWCPEEITYEINSMDEAVERITVEIRRFLMNRLRDIGHVGFEVSGGLDSSTLFAIGRDIAPRTTAGSTIFQGSLDAPYIEILRHTYNNNWLTFDGDLFPAFAPSQFIQCEPYTGFAEGLQWHELESFKQAGAELLVSGAGGDQVFGVNGNYDFLADMLRNMRLIKFSRYLKSSAQDGNQRIVTLLRNNVIRPLMNLEPKYKEYPQPSRPEVPKWLNPDFVTKFNLHERLQVTSWHKQIRGYARRRHIFEILGKYMWPQFIDDYYMGKQLGIVKTFPYVDRLVLETVLRIRPEVSLVNLGQGMGLEKCISRRIAYKFLPREVAARRDKAMHDSMWYNGMKLYGPSIIDKITRSHVVSKYINVSEFRKEWNLASQGMNNNFLTFWWSVCVAMWLSTRLESGGGLTWNH